MGARLNNPPCFFNGAKMFQLFIQSRTQPYLYFLMATQFIVCFVIQENSICAEGQLMDTTDVVSNVIGVCYDDRITFFRC